KPAPSTEGETRPTLGLPPKHSTDNSSGSGQHQETTADNGAPTGDHQNPPKTPEETPIASPAQPPSGQLPPDRFGHDGQSSNHGQQDNSPTAPTAPSTPAPVTPAPETPVPQSPGGAPSGQPAGDDGSLSPAAPAAPLPGGDSYDLLGHDAPPATPITDELSP